MLVGLGYNFAGQKTYADTTPQKTAAQISVVHAPPNRPDPTPTHRFRRGHRGRQKIFPIRSAPLTADGPLETPLTRHSPITGSTQSKTISLIADRW
jgi:hypothetical protein